MARKLPRLSRSLLEKPQLISPMKMEEVAEVFDNRSEYMKANKELFFLDMDEEDELEVDDNYGDPTLGILRVEGPTTYKPSPWAAWCGGTSYVGLLDQMKDFAAQGKTKVLMKVDSPGGVAYRMTHTARELRRIADENGIKLSAYVDGDAASAGLGLCSAAHEIVINPDGEIGSCGVVIGLVDYSQMESDAGIRRIYVTSGEKKRPFKEDGSFKEEFIDDLQEDCDALYDKFTGLVAEMRGMTVDAVKATEADMYRADEALEIGFVDAVMEEPEFLEYLLGRKPEDAVDNSEKPDVSPYEPEASASNLNTSKVNEQMPTQEEVQELAEMKSQLAALTAQAEAAATELKIYKQKEREAAEAALSTKLDSFTFVADHKEALMSFMSAGGEEVALMATVLESAESALEAAALAADEAVATAKEESAAALEAAAKEAADAKAEATSIKEEFGKQQCIVGEPEGKTVEAEATGSARTANLAARVKEIKSNK